MNFTLFCFAFRVLIAPRWGCRFVHTLLPSNMAHNMHRIVSTTPNRYRPSRRILIAAVSLAAATLLGYPFHYARAHHGWGTFDTRYAYYVAGTVKEVQWGNPHSEVVLTVEKTEIPNGLRDRQLPPGGMEQEGKLTLASARPLTVQHKEVHLVLAGPSWMERWGLKRPLRVGEWLETVGYLNTAEDDELRPVMFWLADGQGVWQQLTAFPQQPLPAPK